MAVVDFFLNHILANPYQPRETEDPEHIKKLALSILADGLMQTPLGRIVDSQGIPINAAGYTMAELAKVGECGARVQLAFGHSRLAAFKFLTDTKNKGYTYMPVQIRNLTDEEMFRMSIRENIDRKDLNPLEEAKAMLRYRDDFGKSSAEIGSLFGLAESSVRNKMRLMGLPEDIRVKLSAGELSEGAARELISLFDLPEKIQNLDKRTWVGATGTRVSVLDFALTGAPADQVHEAISRLIEIEGNNLSEAKWKWDEPFDKALDARIQSETCKGCPLALKRNKADYCLDKACWTARGELKIRARLAAASAVCGIKPQEDLSKNVYYFTELSYRDAEDIRASGCENLRLVYNQYSANRSVSTRVPGYDDMVVMCSRKGQYCTCAQGIEARARLQAAGIDVTKTAAGLRMTAEARTAAATAAAGLRMTAETNPAPATAEDLKDIAGQARRAKKQMTEEVKAMQEDFAKRMATGFMNLNPHVLLRAMQNHFYSQREEWEKAQAEEIIFHACRKVADDLYNLDYNPRINPADALTVLNRFLKQAGLPEMTTRIEDSEPVYETIEQELADPAQSREQLLAGQLNREMLTEFSMPGQLPGETLVEYFTRTDKLDADAEIVTEF